MKIKRRKKPSEIEGGHYFVRAKTIPIYICVADHKCEEVRDVHGRPILWSAREASQT